MVSEGLFFILLVQPISRVDYYQRLGYSRVSHTLFHGRGISYSIYIYMTPEALVKGGQGIDSGPEMLCLTPIGLGP